MTIAIGDQIFHCRRARLRERQRPRVVRGQRRLVLSAQRELAARVRPERDPIVRPERARVGIGRGAARQREQQVPVGLISLLRRERLAAVPQGGLQLALLRCHTHGEQESGQECCQGLRECCHREDLKVTAPASAH